MKKIVFALIIPLFFIMIIWLINFQFTYGDLSLLSKTHVDLKSMFARFTLYDELNNDFASTFRSLIDTFKTIQSSSTIGKIIGSTSNGWTIALQGIVTAIDPLYGILYSVTLLGYLLVLVVQFLGITTVVATALFDFIFDPIFIVNGVTLITPIDPIPSIPPILPPIM